ncbi:intracellular protein transport protein [Malassezia pachydermatis]|uniref:Tether containing ubx domain for glut4 n=1 Tax=Malassezia pachydermatis TaxID=77020 RepID=A0A0M9VNQ2_9BASI|nr:tether containing ubx domain for glut4 [Malassezia pachydermatis]KOS13583.1 tether containing ubx domain for glut4 [Malassezia pachydermatis]
MSSSSDAGPSTSSFSVYRAPNSRAYAPPPPEADNFEPTSAELRAAYADAIAEKHGPNAPLMTRAMREKREAALGKTKKQYDSIRIRVRFADRTQIEQAFSPSATINDVYNFVDAVTDPHHGTYILFQSPPRREFPRAPVATAPTLLSLGFAPAAVLSIRWTDAAKNASHAAAPLKPDVLGQARDMPIPPTFSTPSSQSTTTSDAKDAREKRHFPKWFKSTGGSTRLSK